jgi:hypothetical protein
MPSTKITGINQFFTTILVASAPGLHWHNACPLEQAGMPHPRLDTATNQSSDGDEKVN